MGPPHYRPAMQPNDSILIVDFGSQVTQLIARRVREAGVYSEIAPFNGADEAFERLRPKGIILSGGPSSVMSDDSPRAPRPRKHSVDSGTGRGLVLVEQLSENWGVEPRDGGKVVWFELCREPAEMTVDLDAWDDA